MFSRYLEVDIVTGVLIGMGIVLFYAVLGGMKGITYTQVAQYCVLIFAYTVPAVFLAFMVTGNPVPQIALGGVDADEIRRRADAVVDEVLALLTGAPISTTTGGTP